MDISKSVKILRMYYACVVCVPAANRVEICLLWKQLVHAEPLSAGSRTLWISANPPTRDISPRNRNSTQTPRTSKSFRCTSCTAPRIIILKCVPVVGEEVGPVHSTRGTLFWDGITLTFFFFWTWKNRIFKNYILINFWTLIVYWYTTYLLISLPLEMLSWKRTETIKSKKKKKNVTINITFINLINYIT